MCQSHPKALLHVQRGSASWQCINIVMLQKLTAGLTAELPCCAPPCCHKFVPFRLQLEHLKAYHLNQALCSPAVQSCARVVARVAHVALSEASKLELDFPQRCVPSVTLCVLQNFPQRSKVLVATFLLLQTAHAATPNQTSAAPLLRSCVVPLCAGMSGHEGLVLMCLL